MALNDAQKAGLAAAQDRPKAGRGTAEDGLWCLSATLDNALDCIDGLKRRIEALETEVAELRRKVAFTGSPIGRPG